MGLFGKKKIPGMGSPMDVPTERVLQMRQQGISNDQIIQSLQGAGYTSSQIFDAMSQADIKSAAGGDMQQMQQPAGPVPEMQMGEGFGSMPPMEGLPPLPEEAPAPQMKETMDRAAIEEIAESIIDEKWEELMKNVDKIVEWKEATEERLAKMEQRINDLKERFESLNQGVLAKVSEYDRGIREVGTDIKAMEEVFKKVLPTFTANINELSRVTQRMKKPSSLGVKKQ